jgi:hypothetical protein
MIDLHVSFSDGEFRIIQFCDGFSECRDPCRCTIAVIVLVHDVFPHDFIASLWHAEAVHAIDGRVSTEKGDGFFVFVARPGLHLVHEAADGEVDIFGEVRDRILHKCNLRNTINNLSKILTQLSPTIQNNYHPYQMALLWMCLPTSSIYPRILMVSR